MRVERATMMINDILHRAGRNKRKKRIGRGIGSGHGKTSTRGSKGSGARAGRAIRPLTEGGQMPLFRRIPKRGFSNAQFRTEYQVVNVSDLEKRFDAGTKVTAVVLEEAGLIRDAARPVKVLGTGEIKKKFEVEAAKFSASAIEKITKAGGKAETVNG
jgi:large subunit ribosomal protein L15